MAGGRYSLDTGRTWLQLPRLSDVVPGTYNRDAKFLGTMIFQVVEDPVNDDGSNAEEARAQWLYRIDLEAETPQWERVFVFP